MSMIQIIGHRTEDLPPRRLVGKRYTNVDRDPSGSFAPKWKVWMQTRSCEPLFLLKLEADAGEILGFMREDNGNFEYWIGRHCRPDAAVPPDYESLDLPAAKIAVVFLRGAANDPSIFGMHEECLKYLTQKGFTLALPPFFAERYVTGRFCHPDADGLITLDYLISVQ